MGVASNRQEQLIINNEILLVSYLITNSLINNSDIARCRSNRIVIL